MSTLLYRQSKFKAHDEQGISYGNEALSFQGNNLLRGLSDCFAALRKTKITTADILATNFNTVISEATGFTVDLSVTDESSESAYVYVPTFDQNHPFFDEMSRTFNPTLGEQGFTAVGLLGEQARGSVNLKTLKVSGIFSKIPVRIFITLGLIRDRRYTNEELAGVLIHELGHAFTFVYYLGHVVTGNMIVTQAAHAIMKTEDVGERVKILKHAEKVLGIELPNKDEIVTQKTNISDALEIVYIASHRKRYRSITGTDIYDLRTCEQIADQFGAMHGASAPIASMLFKLYKKYNDASTVGAGYYVLVETVKLVSTIAILPFVFLALFCTNPVINIYDNPKDRVIYLRKHINNILKSNTLSTADKKHYLKEIEVIKALEEQMNSRKTWFYKLNTIFNRETARRENEAVVQKNIESLIFNDLFAQTTEISIIK